MARDDFSEDTKRRLAARAGNVCSMPGCGLATSGPSEESSSASANTGTAAHICSASSGRGARRYDPEQTSEQRSSIENGIWCCATHGRLIDCDEVKYTVEQLKIWKRIAEKKAEIRQFFQGVELDGSSQLFAIGMAPSTLRLERGAEYRELIADAISDCCVKAIWGKPTYDALKDFLIECVRNVFDHTVSTEVDVAFGKGSVKILYSSEPFDWEVLATPGAGRGGGEAYRALLDVLRVNAISACHDDRGINTIYIPFANNSSELAEYNPCVIDLPRFELWMKLMEDDLGDENLLKCNRLYVVAPKHVTYSDVPWAQEIIKMKRKLGKKITIFLPDASAKVASYFEEHLDEVEVVAF
ncbi:hypothetical protein [Pseudomonas sp. NPDC090592]|uniref:hypothetical protein n=1 Tax=Pseudomonas sp. NPDC090592 TaxID=3364480 RepID=UPI00383BAB53